jgi:tetratricopeptide (TPR) repeat protein
MRPARVLAGSVCAAGLLGFAWLTGVTPPEPSDCEGEPCRSRPPVGDVRVEQTQTALRRSQPGGELDTAAAAVAGERGIVPAGDSCGMRRPHAIRALPRDVRAIYAAAEVAGEAETALALLQRAALAAPSAAWRAELGKAKALRRSGRADEALPHAQAALDAAPTAHCRADAWFALALASSGERRRAALEQAVRDDPGHYDAWAVLAAELAGQLAGGGSARSCDADAALMIEAIVHLDALARTDGQLARLERRASTVAPAGVPAREILSAMVMQRTGRPRLAAAAYERALAAPAGPCAAPIQLVARRKLGELRFDEDSD